MDGSGFPTFWGVWILPVDKQLEDIPKLYEQWTTLDIDDDFPDWLAKRGFVEEKEVGYCWLHV